MLGAHWSSLQACVYALCIITMCAPAGGEASTGPSSSASKAPSLSATLKRLKCIGHTQPVFDPARCSDGWDCKLYLPKAAELETDGHACTCCMGELSVDEARLMLNATHVVFVGDSTARRAAGQLKAFLEGDPNSFHDIAYHHDAITHVDVQEADTATDISSYWLPHVDDLAHAIRSRGAGLFLDREALNVPSDAPVIIVYCYSTHDLLRIAAAHHWERHDLPANETTPELDAEMPGHPRDIPVEDLAKLAAEFAQQLVLVHAALRGDTDIVLVRLPITQACKANEYANMCRSATAPSGAEYCLEDPMNDGLVDYLTHRMRQEVVQRLRLTAGVLPMTWTRAPDVEVPSGGQAGTPVLHHGADRHPCTPADMGGTHFGTVPGRMAFVQQVLHAASLMARDRPGWTNRPWMVARALDKEFHDNVCY